MRISDWSSDVCSSDLLAHLRWFSVLTGMTMRWVIWTGSGSVETSNAPALIAVIVSSRPCDQVNHSPFVGVLKLCMEAPLNVKAAINLSDDFQRNGRPCFKLIDRKSTRLNSSH